MARDAGVVVNELPVGRRAPALTLALGGLAAYLAVTTLALWQPFEPTGEAAAADRAARTAAVLELSPAARAAARIRLAAGAMPSDLKAGQRPGWAASRAAP